MGNRVMKKLFNYMMFMSLLLTFSACEEEEVMTFDAERGINFVNYDANYDQYTDDYKRLVAEYDFYKQYAKEASMELKPCTLSVGLQLEGNFSDKPLKVKIKAEAIEGYEMPEITLPEEVVIEAGSYQANFPVICSQPKDYEKDYKAKLVIDYVNSDVKAGTKERQTYEISVSDKTNFKEMWVENETEWNADFAEYLGNFGGTKVRFVFASLAKLYGNSYNNTCTIYRYTQIGGSYLFYGFYYYGYDVYYDLEDYNSTHDEPLCEPDGTLVEIPNIY